ncbi:MAG: Hint domain-containing protein [Leptolyngbyaceae bacterium]|nr:Hint domain-containing protein [Leptolyngbyaceae bacterium]
MTTPSNENQLMLELINRARANPQAEADRLLSGDLNQNLAAGTISTDPKQPLVWNGLLANAAIGHTNDMFQNDFFSHTGSTGSTAGQRITAAGYPWSTYGENLAVTVNSGPQILATETSKHHDNLFISSGHRQNIMGENFREVGLGTQLGTNYQGPFSTTWNYAALTTQVYGDQASSNPFLTGVVFTDAIASDDFYTIGEGLGSVTVNVFNDGDDSLAGSTTTYSSGGYRIQLAAGVYDIFVTADFDQDSNTPDETKSVQNVVLGPDNVKVDFECFLAGTHILTDSGEKPVETLQIGDRVYTANGSAIAIKWIGRQTWKPGHISHPLRTYPIQIKAGALGDKVPYRDLWVSPDHGVFVDGLLINAGALVNGVSIIQTQPTEPFVYYHVELEAHRLLVAEGVAAESYLPQKEDRHAYDNGAEYGQRYPRDNGILAYWPMRYPRVSSQRQLPRYVSKQLMAIALALSTDSMAESEIRAV